MEHVANVLSFPAMKHVQKLGKNLSRLSFGGAAISGEGKGYGFGDIKENQAIDLLLAALDSGINVFDFAPIYGFNLAEQRAGLAFKSCREKAHLVSKCGVTWHENGRVNMTNEPDVALKMLDQSLKNFQSDYVDIYLVHWPDPKVDIRRVMDSLYGAKEKGKIHHLGLCNTTKEDLILAREVAPIEVIQCEHNLFQSKNFEQLKEQTTPEMFTMGWGSYDKGILAGTVHEDRSFDSEDCRSWAPWWKKSDWKKRSAFVGKSMERFSIDADQMAQSALNFSLGGVDSAICGMRSERHLLENLARMRNGRGPKYFEIIDEFSLF